MNIHLGNHHLTKIEIFHYLYKEKWSNFHRNEISFTKKFIISIKRS